MFPFSKRILEPPTSIVCLISFSVSLITPKDDLLSVDVDFFMLSMPVVFSNKFIWDLSRGLAVILVLITEFVSS